MSPSGVKSEPSLNGNGHLAPEPQSHPKPPNDQQETFVKEMDLQVNITSDHIDLELSDYYENLPIEF